MENKSVSELLKESIKVAPAGEAKIPAPEKKKEVVSSATDKQINIDELTEEQALALDIDMIVAKPLGLGDGLNFEPIKKEYAYRWVNKQEQRYSVMRALGFTNATLDDVKLPNDEIYRDGAIRLGDTILMKIPKMQFFGALKNNIKRAAIMGAKDTLDKKGMDEGKKIISSLRGPQDEISKKVSIYVPPIGELGK